MTSDSYFSHWVGWILEDNVKVWVGMKTYELQGMKSYELPWGYKKRIEITGQRNVIELVKKTYWLGTESGFLGVFLRARRKTENQYESLGSVLSNTIHHQGWKVEEIRFTTGVWQCVPWMNGAYGKTSSSSKSQRVESSPSTRNWTWEYSTNTRISWNTFTVIESTGVQSCQGLPSKTSRP